MTINRLCNIVEHWLSGDASLDVWANLVKSVTWHKKWNSTIYFVAIGIWAMLFILLLVELTMFHPDEDALPASVLYTTVIFSIGSLALMMLFVVVVIMGLTDTSGLSEAAQEYMSDIEKQYSWFRHRPRPTIKFTPSELAIEKRMIWNSYLVHVALRVVLLQKAEDDRATDVKRIYNEVFSLGERLLGFGHHDHGDMLRLAQTRVDSMSEDGVRDEIRKMYWVKTFDTI